MSDSHSVGAAEQRPRVRPLVLLVDDDPVFITHLEKPRHPTLCVPRARRMIGIILVGLARDGAGIDPIEPGHDG